MGVIFNHDAQWDEHLKNVYFKSCKGMALVKKLRQSKCPCNIIWLAYQSLVVSHVGYCWPLICDIPERLLNKIRRLEKVACRWAFKNSQEDIRQRLNLICIRLIRKIALAKNPHPLSRHFVQRSVDYPLRSQRVLAAPKTSSRMIHNSFYRFCVYT